MDFAVFAQEALRLVTPTPSGRPACINRAIRQSVLLGGILLIRSFARFISVGHRRQITAILSLSLCAGLALQLSGALLGFCGLSSGNLGTNCHLLLRTFYALGLLLIFLPLLRDLPDSRRPIAAAIYRPRR